MGACCTTENKSKNITSKPLEKKEQIKLQMKNGNTRKSHQVSDAEEKLDLILNPAAGENLEELKSILRGGKLEINKYLEKEDNETILTKAIKNNSKPEIIKFLLDNGADVNLCEKASGHSPLILACLNLNKSIVELILTRNPSFKVNSEDIEDKNENLINYLKKKFSGNNLKGENTWEEIRDLLEEFDRNNKNRQ